MFVHLDLGWMSHPFPLSSFRIADAQQIETIRALGLSRVRWSPEQSDPTVSAPLAPPAADPGVARAAVIPLAEADRTPTIPPRQRDPAAAALAAQRAAIDRVERQYTEAARGWRQSMDLVAHEPLSAGQRMAALAQAMVDKMLGARDLSIRVLAETPGDRASHALNVSVIAMLMGKVCGLSPADLQDLGLGALTHDIGKIELPHRLHRADPRFSTAETALYREHVAHGVALGRRMGLSPGALLVIAQHHEHCDGSGFPQGLDCNRMSMGARMVALVNRYDNLCHPAPGVPAMTPHEALSLLFAQGQGRYDAAILSTFVRMMGVYPAGSLVQLTDERWAMVMQVNSSRPLKPRVLVHDAKVPRDEALLLDLEREPALGIRRSVAPSKLPAAALAYLAPRPRVSYYFDALAAPVADDGTGA